MAVPGWYPDPSGEPETLRYFDGTSWTAHTSRSTTQPAPEPEPAPAPLAPLPSVFDQHREDDSVGQGWPPRGGVDDRSRRTTGLLLAVVAVLALVGIVAVSVFGLSFDDGGPEAGPASPSAQPSDPPSGQDNESAPPTPEDADPVCVAGDPAAGALPPTGEGISGGDLTLPLVRGFPLVAGAGAFTFADGVISLARQIEESWIAQYALGSVMSEDGAGLEETAETVLECMTASPNIYSGFSERTDLDSGAVEVDGREAWSLTAEVRVDDPDVEVEGDVVQVVVVDTGDEDSYSLFVSVVPIGDAALIRQQERTFERLSIAGRDL